MGNEHHVVLTADDGARSEDPMMLLQVSEGPWSFTGVDEDGLARTALRRRTNEDTSPSVTERVSGSPRDVSSTPTVEPPRGR